MKDYQYPDWVNEELTRCLRGMLPPRTPLKQATKTEDYGGVDAHYIVNHHTAIAIRCRFNRPPWAADCDVTFRTTEPAMMRAGTYAPLAVFAWFVEHHIAVAKLVDIQRMVERLDPPVWDRAVCANGDGTGFHIVEISELHRIGALLRIYDGSVWCTEILGGNVRLAHILEQWRRTQVTV